MKLMKLKDMIERKRQAKLACKSSLDPIKTELEDCGIMFEDRPGMLFIRLPGPTTDKLVIKADPDNPKAFQWGINRVVPLRIVDRTSILTIIAEYLA